MTEPASELIALADDPQVVAAGRNVEMLQAVPFRAAWLWMLLWFLLDIASYGLRDHLPEWLAVTSPDLAMAITKDAYTALFLIGLWIFERVSIPEKLTQP